MDTSTQLERFFEVLIAGDRPQARQIVDETLAHVGSPQDLIPELFWPAYELIEKLYRADQLTRLSHHCGTRLLRVLIDQNTSRFTIAPPIGRSVLAFCGPQDSDELGAQMGVDLLESAGFQVTFAGGNIPNDEILQRVHSTRPDVLLMFAAGAPDLPSLRRLIDTLREIGACPDIQLVVGGGVFNRADGLAEEIGADLWAPNPLELVSELQQRGDRRAPPEQRTVGRKRRARRAA
ncbi:MAG: cobalamin-dependent protein [Planctomycetes bacterium]|nr:cobalamin-dependent protein [Planctomycetota bacterium]MCH9058168.1 cobalamin B12-binding domain-containing protein [Planctomycetota bacterium]